MDSVCTDEHHHHNHKFHHVLSPKKCLLHDMNIPPRKLLSRRASLTSSPDEIRYLHYNNNNNNLDHHCVGSEGGISFDVDVDDEDPYSSDEFRMYEFKIRKCTRSRSHDWTDCPFSHPGEKARRRDPRRFHYAGTVCPDYSRSGGCVKGDECEFAHGVFECWLHPVRYRTEACKDGKNCKRKVCFFAHSPRQLRVLPPHQDGDDNGGFCGSTSDRYTHTQHCCRCCALSPTSTLLNRSHISPPLSPPMSPMKAIGLSGFSPVSRYSDRVTPSASGDSLGMSYEDIAINELLLSLEGMRINEAIANNMKSCRTSKVPVGLWVDVPYDNGHDHVQFTQSPSTPMNPSSLSRDVYDSNNNQSSASASTTVVATTSNVFGKAPESGIPGPDLGWVNDLLM